MGLGREAGRDGVCAVQTVKLWWYGGDVHDELVEEEEEQKDLVHDWTEQVLLITASHSKTLTLDKFRDGTSSGNPRTYNFNISSRDETKKRELRR